MKKTGPPLSSIMHRIATIPGDFMSMPIMKASRSNKDRGRIKVTAVISDLLYAVGNSFLDPSLSDLFDLPPSNVNRNFLGIILIAAYVYYDPFFHGKKELAQKMLDFFSDPKLLEISKLVNCGKFVNDPERREELARMCLNALGMIPEGETASVAKDRLNTLDSIERARIVKKTREAQERARKLREAMARREAEEAASKMSRE